MRFFRWLLVALLGALFLVPFLYTGTTIYPFVFGKAIALWLIAAAATLVWLIHAAFDPAARIRRSPALTALGFFCLVLVLSAAFGVDPARSIWSGHNRMMGLTSIFSAFILIPLAAIALGTERAWRRFFAFGLFTATIMAIIGLIQYFSSTQVFNLGGGGKIWAVLGNSIYLGQYALFFIFIAGWLAVVASNRMWRVAALASVALQVMVLFLTETRGALIGLAFGLLVLAALLWFRRTGVLTIPLRVRIWSGTVLAAAGIIFFFWGGNMPGIEAIPGLRRLTYQGIADVSGGNATRIIGWKIALEALAARPIFGWGPENYNYAFNALYHPESLRYGSYETWFDRSHNAHLDLLATTGAAGGIAMLAFYGALGVVLLRESRRSREGLLRASFAAALLVSYLAQLSFAFDSVSSLILASLLYAWIVRIGWGDRAATAESRGTLARTPLVATALASIFTVGFGIMVWKIGVLPVRAAHYDVVMQYQFYRMNDPAQALASYELIRAIPTPYRRDIVMDFANETISYLGRNTTPTPAAAAWKVAVADTTAAAARAPRDALLRLTLAELLARGAPFDPQATVRAAQEYATALELSPKRQQIYFESSSVAYTLGDMQAALRLAASGYDLDPEAVTARWQFGLALAVAGRIQDGYALISSAITKHPGRLELDTAEKYSGVAELAAAAGDTSGALWYKSRALDIDGEKVAAYQAARAARTSGFTFKLWDDLLAYAALAGAAGDPREAYRTLHEDTGSLINTMNEYEKHARYAEAAYAAGFPEEARIEARRALPGGYFRYRRRLNAILAE